MTCSIWQLLLAAQEKDDCDSAQLNNTPSISLTEDKTENEQKWQTLLLLALAELLAMSVWFSASAVVPAFSMD